MPNKYKRKFLVPGETPKTEKWKYRDAFHKRNCQGRCPHYPNRYMKQMPCTQGYYTDYTKCIYQDEVFSEYIVGETETGEWECSCKAWTTTIPRKDCKHIRKAKGNPKKYEIDPEYTGKAIETLKKVIG